MDTTNNAGPTTGPATVDSASDARTTNNVMRHEYRVLSDLEKLLMKDIKDQGLQFLDLIDSAGRNTNATTDPRNNSSRELALAKTKIEEAVMWAVKHITR